MNMKKFLFLIAAVLFGVAVTAQGNNTEKIVRKSMLALHLGPSFPTGQFTSHNLPSTGFADLGGFAKTGIQGTMSYSYSFLDYFGLTGDLFYNRHNLDKAAIEEHAGSGFTADHWQSYGILAGPYLSFQPGDKVALDLRLMGGAVHVNSPEIKFVNNHLLAGDWEWAPIIKGEVDVRVDIGKDVYFLISAGVPYTWSYFTVATEDWSYAEEVKMRLPAINLTGGFGIKF